MSSKLRKSDTDAISELYRLGNTATQIAKDLCIPRSTVRDYLARQDRDDWRRAATPPSVPAGLNSPTPAFFDNPLRPLPIVLPKPGPVAVEEHGTYSVLLYGDTHVPHEDTRTTAVVRRIAGLLRPNLICHMGDLLDGYSLSRFDKDPGRIDSLQEEINLARAHLALMRQSSPNSRFLLLEGNHEDRLRRTIWNMPGPMAALAKLDVFQASMIWPRLLDLDELGVEWVPHTGQAKQSFLPKFILKHGTIVRKKSAYTASGELDKYGRSGASGHTHRLGAHWHNDHNGSHLWIETGCTCSLDPEYTEDPDWQAGCVVLTFDLATGAVAPELIEIRNGLAMWRGLRIHADEEE